MSRGDQTNDENEFIRKKFTMPKLFVELIDELIEKGPFTNRSEVVRNAIQEYHHQQIESGGFWFDELVDHVCHIREIVDEIYEELESTDRSRSDAHPTHDTKNIRTIDESSLGGSISEVMDEIYKSVNSSDSITTTDLFDDLDFESFLIAKGIQQLENQGMIEQIETDDKTIYKISYEI